VTILNRILITGAAGSLGGELRKSGPAMARRVRLADRNPCRDLQPHEEDATGEPADFASVLGAVEGCDAIVHLGGRSTDGPWEDVLPSSIVGTYNVYEAARRHGVKRVVYASSIHAVGFYERTDTIDARVPTRPDTLYGVSKTFGENLSSYYFSKFGIESVCLRIGSCFPEPTDRRHLVTWLSFRDFRQLVELSLAAERVGHMICFATSNNDKRFWDNSAAAILGYRPQDNAEDFRHKVIAATDQGDPNDPAVRFQGGGYCRVTEWESRERRGF
jgi:uronate dehydrogenase